MWPNPQFPVTFSEEILNGRLHFLCGDNFSIAHDQAGATINRGIFETKASFCVGWRTAGLIAVFGDF